MHKSQLKRKHQRRSKADTPLDGGAGIGAGIDVRRRRTFLGRIMNRLRALYCISLVLQRA